MNGRMLAAVGLMMAVAGSGCIDAIGFLSSDDDTEVTAMANRDLADSAAQAWSPDAELMAVFAFENNNATPEFPSDPNPGNGRAPLWLYAYTGMNGTEHRAIQVSADGQVRTMNESMDMSQAPDMGDAIDTWSIDSDAAVATARANETFESVASLEDAVLMEALGSQEGMTVWAVMAGTMEGQALAVIDAASGALIMAQAFTMDFDLPPVPMWGGAGMGQSQVMIEESGSLDDSTSTMEYPFEVGRPDAAHIEISFQGMLPTDGMSWAVLDEAGEFVEGGGVQGFFGGGSTVYDFAIESPGAYTLVLEYSPRLGFGPLPGLGSVDYDLMFMVGVMPEMDMSAATTCC